MLKVYAGTATEPSKTLLASVGHSAEELESAEEEAVDLDRVLGMKKVRHTVHHPFVRCSPATGVCPAKPVLNSDDYILGSSAAEEPV